MKLPVVRGVIDRRILINYRVDPAILASLLPAPFRPQIVSGRALVGICLIRLKSVRPTILPTWLGLSSENAAHRAAVVWDENGVVRSGVFVHRRDTDSRLNSLAGGRLFPGIHHHATFTVNESAERFEVSLRSDDQVTSMSVRCRRASQLSPTSVFRSLEEGSKFFEAGSLGFSTTCDEHRFEGIELHCRNWTVEPLEVQEVRSSYFEDTSLFPKGAIEFDSALLMQKVDHEWHGKADLVVNRLAA